MRPGLPLSSPSTLQRQTIAVLATRFLGGRRCSRVIITLRGSVMFWRKKKNEAEPVQAN
jgi:hypothetical protein